MDEEHYSRVVALEIPGKGQVPIPKIYVDSLYLRPGTKAPFTGYKIVAREPVWKLEYCSRCNTDLLVTAKDSSCVFCRVSLRASFLCARCHTADDISHKICSDCGLTVCIPCLVGSNRGPVELPSKCLQCGSERFRTVE